VPLSVNEWIQIAIVSTTIIIVVEIDKAIRRRMNVKAKPESG
jgi:hypothetical protein